jgi:hypothetical protein
MVSLIAGTIRMEKVVGMTESHTELHQDQPDVKDTMDEWTYVKKAPVQKMRNRLVVPGSHMSVWCGNMHDIPSDQIVFTTAARLTRESYGVKVGANVMPWELQNGLNGIAHQAIYAASAEEDLEDL